VREGKGPKCPNVIFPSIFRFAPHIHYSAVRAHFREVLFLFLPAKQPKVLANSHLCF